MASDQSNPYSPADWEADWQWYSGHVGSHLAKGERGVSREMHEAWLRYFEKKYADRAAFHRERLGAALRYFEKVADQLNEGTIAIVSKDTLVAGRPAVLTLWRIYGSPDADMALELPVADMLELCREAEAILKQNGI